MTAVANPPSFPQISRPAWGTINGTNSANTDEARGMLVPRKTLQRSGSSSSISSNGSIASNSTVTTNSTQSTGSPLSTSELSQWPANVTESKRSQPKGSWPLGKPDPQAEFSRHQVGRLNGIGNAHMPLQPQVGPQTKMRSGGPDQFPPNQPVLSLLSLNGTFERKTIAVPYAPDSLRIGRQTNAKTAPTASNGFFDSKVLSRQHAEIYAERNGKIYIRDVKSSNGTFVNGARLSQESRESEPHELQTADHLELGIDIVSEDQKTVVHHKVAAKVEHAGFLSNSNNVLDMNFGDLDPANGSIMMSQGVMPMRSRAASNSSTGTNGRATQNGGMMGAQPGVQQHRSFLQVPVATDQILKRLSNEMRNARIQAQDLNRTNQFINTLLSKDDIKDVERAEIHDMPKSQSLMNGNISPFRCDSKTRFSDPPAPPPQQPLPEKPSVPSLKRPPSDRPKSDSATTSPIRQENLSQIIQLTEALNRAKRDIDAQSARMRELEQMLQREREARELAEGIARRLEHSASTQMNGSSKTNAHQESGESDGACEESRDARETNTDDAPLEGDAPSPSSHETARNLQSRIDNMDVQMQDLKEQMNQWRLRCETAESERDADRKTLAEMVMQLRAEEALRVAAQEKQRTHLDGRVPEAHRKPSESPTGVADDKHVSGVQVDGSANSDELVDLTLSRANTITALTPQRQGTIRDHHLQAGLPYASMVGVVLIGMGLMAYINGWQTPPPRIER